MRGVFYGLRLEVSVGLLSYSGHPCACRIQPILGHTRLSAIHGLLIFVPTGGTLLLRIHAPAGYSPSLGIHGSRPSMASAAYLHPVIKKPRTSAGLRGNRRIGDASALGSRVNGQSGFIDQNRYCIPTNILLLERDTE